VEVSGLDMVAQMGRWPDMVVEVESRLDMVE
jgi:hypothetical protein